MIGVGARDEARAYRACIAQVDGDAVALQAVLTEADNERDRLGLVVALTRITASVVMDGARGDLHVAGQVLRLGLAKLVSEALTRGEDLGFDAEPDDPGE
jgi:hypothetical protein